MSVQCERATRAVVGAPIGVFERWLSLWVVLCIGAGILPPREINFSGE